VSGTGGVRIDLAGEIRIENDDARAREGFLVGRQARLLFALVVLRRPGVVTADALAAELWGAHPPPTWPSALRNVASRVRRFLARARLDPRVLVHGSTGYRLLLPEAMVDVETAERNVEQAVAALEAGDAACAAANARRAEDVLVRPVLAGIDSPMLDLKRNQLQELLLESLDVSAEAYLALGRSREARLAAERATRLNPFRESAYRLLIRAHSDGGSIADAVLTFHQFRRRLRDELGVDPSGQTVDTYLEILRQRPA
jgi:DNA-binding SARP family transcriptional activator